MLGKAAVAMWCDVAPEARDELDDWHAHEHMPERLSIPGFLRGSRWVAADGGAGYFILYEARSEATLTAGPYLERLNDPTPWSRRMMPHHRNMVRSLCRVVASDGLGLGAALLTLRFPAAPRFSVAGLASRKGLVAAGHAISVWNRTAAKAQALVPHGVTVAGSRKELAACDIVFTMDGDLQDDPKEIPRFLAKLDEGFDVGVVGRIGQHARDHAALLGHLQPLVET